jgi:hypothetical protein
MNKIIFIFSILFTLNSVATPSELNLKLNDHQTETLSDTLTYSRFTPCQYWRNYFIDGKMIKGCSMTALSLNVPDVFSLVEVLNARTAASSAQFEELKERLSALESLIKELREKE